MERGRPTKYTDELADEICDVVSASELGLLHLVNLNPHWPDRSNIFKWRLRHPYFRDRYLKAKQDQADVVVEYMHELMNEPHVYFNPETGQNKVDSPLLKLKLDHFKWHAAKLKPKEYGDTKQLETVNTDISDDCKKRYQDLDERNKKEY
jgi:hypothetical protein